MSASRNPGPGRTSLRGQLALSHAVFAVVMMVLAIVIAERSADSQRRAQAVAAADHNAQVLAAHVATAWRRPADLQAALDIESRLQRAAAVVDAAGTTTARTLLDPNQRLRRSVWNASVRSALTGDLTQSVHGDWVLATAPVTIRHDIVGAVAVVERSPAITPWRGPLRTAIEFGLAVVLLAAAGGWLIAARLSHPLHRLTDAAQALALGRSEFVPGDASSVAEVATLSAAVDRVGQRLAELQRKAVERDEADRFALRRLAHAIRTPISVLALRINDLSDESQTARDRQVLNEVFQRQLDALEEAASTMASLAHSSPDRALADVDVSALVRTAVDRVLPLGRWSNIRVRLELPVDAVHVRCIESSMRDAIGNLLENALKYTPAGGTVLVRLSVDGDWVTVAVNDSGPGIPHDELMAVRHPGVRGTSSRGKSGTGFGLASAAAAAEECDGRLELGRADLGGLRASLVLPVG